MDYGPGKLLYLAVDLVGRRFSGDEIFEDLGPWVQIDTGEILAAFMAGLSIYYWRCPEILQEVEGPNYKARNPEKGWDLSERLWQKLLSGFSVITLWHLRRLMVFSEQIEKGVYDEKTKQVLPPPRYWHPPLEKAEACRALAAACRAREPAVDLIWQEFANTVGQSRPDEFQARLKLLLEIGSDDVVRGIIDGDLYTHIAANLESLAIYMERAAAAGETEIALIEIDV